MENKISFLALPIHALTMDQTLSLIDSRIKANLFTQHSVLNVAKVVTCQKDRLQREAIFNCDIVNVDGMGVVWGSRFLGKKIPERVAGIDLFINLLAYAQENHLGIFLLGATGQVLQKAREKISGDYPDILIAGSHHGYFHGNERQVVESILKSNAQMLFVAMPSPDKEYFINRWSDDLGVKFVMGVGGSFDIIAGHTKRAPKLMQCLGLEWFYRFLQEPGRLWKRYLRTNFIFAVLLLKHKFKHFFPTS